MDNSAQQSQNTVTKYFGKMKPRPESDFLTSVLSYKYDYAIKMCHFFNNDRLLNLQEQQKRGKNKPLHS